MKSRERFLAALRREPVDRKPCITGSVYVLEFQKIAGVQWPKMHEDPEAMVKMASVEYTHCGTDNICLPFSFVHEPIALGCEYNIGAPDRQPYITKGLESPDQIEYEKFLEKPSIQVVLKAVKMARERFPDAAITPFVTGPGTLTGYLMNTEVYAKLSFKEPQRVKPFLDIAVKVFKMYVGALIDESGAEFLYVPDPSASVTVITPKAYKELILPAQKECFDFAKSKGAYPYLHMCGRVMPILDAMAQSGAYGISLEQTVDMAEAKKVIGNRAALIGNVTPMLLVEGPVEKIREEVKTAIVKGVDIVMPGCGTPPLAKPEYIKAMVQATIEYFSLGQ
jgi:[methyl-Co(III) methanol-specific corrinoid protein]:coenzyme M methyltransferase